MLIVLTSKSVFARDPVVVPPFQLSVSLPLDSDPETQKSSSRPAFWIQLAEVLGSCLLTSGIDYYAYNSYRNDPDSLIRYRIAQAGLQLGVSSALFFLNGGVDDWREGLKVALTYNFIHWTFLNDFIYYGIAEFVPADNAKGFQGEGAWKEASDPNAWGTRHAWWTPLGIFRMATGTPKKDLKFSPSELYAQTIVGSGIAISALALDFWKKPESSQKTSFLSATPLGQRGETMDQNFFHRNNDPKASESNQGAFENAKQMIDSKALGKTFTLSTRVSDTAY